MLHHIIFMKLKEGVSSSRLEEFTQAVEKLPQEIEGVTRATTGRTINPEKNQGYNWVISVELTDRAALNHYLKHPYHRKLADEHVHLLRDGDFTVFDYETQ